MNTTNRRSFLKQTGATAAGLAFYGAAAQFTRAQGPGNRMRVAVMGLGRGLVKLVPRTDGCNQATAVGGEGGHVNVR